MTRPRRLTRHSPPKTSVRRASPATRDTKGAIFLAAAQAFSARGYDGVIVDDIARHARVNKAMIYYHFRDKLALYREVVGDMLRAAAARIRIIAESADPPAEKIRRFVQSFVELGDERPWFPTLMLREIAEGAPHLDAETLNLMRDVFVLFTAIVIAGQASGAFRPVHPVLAYMSVIGPLLLNAARERAASRRDRGHLPMFVAVSHQELSQHLQETAVRMLKGQ